MSIVPFPINSQTLRGDSESRARAEDAKTKLRLREVDARAWRIDQGLELVGKDPLK